MGLQTPAPPPTPVHWPARAPCWQSASLKQEGMQTGTEENPPLQDPLQRPPSTVAACSIRQVVPVGHGVEPQATVQVARNGKLS
jgi:hypothetical protein